MSDEYSRKSIASTILKYHKIRVDWRKHTWQEMSDLYQRLNQAKNIKNKWGVDVAWQTTTLQELVRTYHSGEVA